MTNFINKTKTAVSGAALFAAGIVMAGLGLAALSVVALFALMGIGIALLAAPFVALSQTEDMGQADQVDGTVNV